MNEQWELQRIGTVHSAGVYKKGFSTCWSQLLPHYDLEYLSTIKKMLRRRIQAHDEQLSKFERGRIIGLKEAGWANGRIACHMGRLDAAIRRCWQEWVDNGRFQRHDNSGQNRATVGREDRLSV
ncbi:uncharacterized protein TNCV_5103591 [Trichonephila clavipes]|nr:uncharacterized protein TNCV_5103591 [Trichonephila clavipes]